MTEDERRLVQAAWQSVLLLPGATDDHRFARLKLIFDKAAAGGCNINRPWTVVAVARPTDLLTPCDALLLCYDRTSTPHLGPEVFVGIVGGTRQGVIRLPIRVFVCDDQGHCWQAELDENGDWQPL